MKDIFGGDGFAPDPAFGESDVFRDLGVQMMTDHQHIEMLVEGVHRVGPRRVCGRRQHVGPAADLDDIGGVAAAGTFGMEGMDSAVLERGDGVLHKAGLIERVGVDRYLDIDGFCDGEAGIDGRRGGAPILVQFETAGAGGHLFHQRVRLRCVALAEKAQVHGQALGSLQHATDVPGTGGAGGGVCAVGRDRCRRPAWW